MERSVGKGAVTKNVCVFFVCMQIIYIMCVFRPPEKRTGRHVAMYCNYTYNRRPFFCVLSALIV